MVTVVDLVKQQTEDGKEFIRLLLQGDDLTLCTTDAGRVYAKVSKASIIAPISEEVTWVVSSFYPNVEQAKMSALFLFQIIKLKENEIKNIRKETSQD